VRRTVGWAIITLSCALWTALPLVPFLALSTAELTYWAGGLFIAAEVTWYAGLALLGPEAIVYLKSLWQRLRSIWSKTNTPNDSD
jgi:hypothetical protein